MTSLLPKLWVHFRFFLVVKTAASQSSWRKRKFASVSGCSILELHLDIRSCKESSKIMSLCGCMLLYPDISLLLSCSLSYPYPRPSHNRGRRHRGDNDSWAQREGDSQPAGKKHHRDDVHYHRYPELAEIREPHVGCVCLHLLHRPDDHFPRMAGLLLYPEVSICKCQGQEPGE